MKSGLREQTFLFSKFEVPVPKLPNYTWQQGAVVEASPNDTPILRRCMWKCWIEMSYKRSYHNPYFKLKFTYRYIHANDGSTVSSVLDSYAKGAERTLVYKTERHLKHLIKDDKFLYYLKYLIISGMHKIKNTKHCNEVVNYMNSDYKVICGNQCFGNKCFGLSQEISS